MKGVNRILLVVALVGIHVLFEYCKSVTPECKYISGLANMAELSKEESRAICRKLDELAQDSIGLFIHTSDTLPPSTEIIHITNQILSSNQAFNSDWIILFITADKKSFYIHLSDRFKDKSFIKKRSDLKKYVYDNLNQPSFVLFDGFISMFQDEFLGN